ncbi:hypothetical protein [Neobacillus sp. NPDC093127]|uniref:hypothetical protein n=1 Tax=Neobacillus sp. NPDC093127 TaxID=3364296 RepID=UPI0038159F6C
MDIIFKTNNIPAQQQESIISFFDSNLYKLGLDLTSLEGITICENFFEDIIEFQTKHKKREIGATKTSNEAAIAKVLDYIDKSDSYKQVVFLSDFIAQGLFLEEEIAQRSFHFINHELVHVHDEYNKKCKIYSEKARQGIGDHVLDHILRVHADAVWSEYIAERLSSPTVTASHISSFMDHITQLIERVEENVKNEISQYRFHADIDKLFSIVQEECLLLLKISANLVGVIHGLSSISDGKNKVEAQIDELFVNTYLFQIWNKLKEELNNLIETYPNWNDVYQLDRLGKVVLSCWSFLGVLPEKSGEQMYINVPL